jgi:hypothetical protein
MVEAGVTNCIFMGGDCGWQDAVENLVISGLLRKGLRKWPKRCGNDPGQRYRKVEPQKRKSPE